MALATQVALWWILGGWFGALLLFAFVVAPNAFVVLPAEAAGSLVSPVLGSLQLYGMGAGVALAAIAARLERGRLLIFLPLVLALLCAISHFVITPGIAEVRPSELGPDSAVESAARFALLHRASELVYAAVGLGTLALTVLHARADVAARSGRADGIRVSPS